MSNINNYFAKAFIINGSPRANGNTGILLKRVSELLEKSSVYVNYYNISENFVKPCKACGKCREMQNKTCIIKDDAFHKLFERVLDSDIIIVGSPVYFSSATPDVMAFLDRAGYVSRANGNLLSKKIGGPIVVGRRAGHNFTYAQLLLWYNINNIIIVGSSYWNVGFGRNIGEVNSDSEALSTIEAFSMNLVWLVTKIKN